MKLTVRTRKIPIVRATLGASIHREGWAQLDPTLIPNELHWGFEFECEEKSFEELWAPRFSFDRFRLPVRRWVDLAERSVSLKKGRCYFIGHDDVPRAKLSLGKRRGATFPFVCKGVCDIGWEKPFDRNVPFEAQGRLNFVGIRVGGAARDNDQSLSDYLKSAIELDRLREAPCEKHEAAGRKFSVKHFSPA